MTAPTTDQIKRVLAVIEAGLDIEDAIETIWADEPEAPAPKAPPKPTVMVTEFPDGVVIGWDFCAQLNGGCGKHVSKCTCKGGPHELAVFARWRSGESDMPNYSDAARAASRAGAPKLAGGAATGVVVATQEPVKGTPGQVKCIGHDGFVLEKDADKNDDNTWTCHACQESGFQRGVPA